MFHKLLLSLLITIGFSTTLLAHKVQGIDLKIEKISDETIKIEGVFKKSKRKLVRNKIRLISMIDKKVLFETHLARDKPTIATIPTESYWVYLYIGNRDVVVEGPAPKNGFKKIADSQKNRALKTTGFITLFFLLSAIALGIFKTRKYKKYSELYKDKNS